VRKLNEIRRQKARSALCFRTKSGKKGGVTNEKNKNEKISMIRK
jgi:hypothetical protein